MMEFSYYFRSNKSNSSFTDLSSMNGSVFLIVNMHIGKITIIITTTEQRNIENEKEEAENRV